MPTTPTSDRTATAGFAPPADWLATRNETTGFPGWSFLILVTLLASLLRFYRLDAAGLWIDEVLTWLVIKPQPGLSFFDQIGDTIQGPLFMAVVWPLIRLSESEVMFRLPSALAGVAVLPLFGVAAGRLFDRDTARLATLLLMLSPFHVWYSQEGRGYAFVTLFSVAASLVYLDMLRRGPQPGRAVLFAVLTACGVWSNMSAVFLWGAQGLTLLLFARPRDRRGWALWTLAFGGGLLLVLPWLLKASGIWAVDRLVPGAATGAALRGDSTFTPMAIPFSGFAFFYGFSLGPSLAELHVPDRMAVVRQHLPLLALAGSVVGIALVSGLVRLRGARWQLVVWAAVALAALVFLAVRNVKTFNVRYLAVIMPWIVLVAAHGLVRLPRRPGAVLTTILIALSLWSLWGYFFNTRYAKADLRGAARLVAAREVVATAAGSSPSVILVPATTPVFKYYYRGSRDVVTGFGARLNDAAGARRFCEEKLAGHDQAWIVLASHWEIDIHDLIPAALTSLGELQLETILPGVRIFTWSRHTPGGG